MKKTWVVVLSAAVLSFPVHAVLLPEGTQELGVSGVVDFQTIGDTLVNVQILYGYFFADAVEAGAVAAFRTDEHYTAWALGFLVEHNFDLGTEFMPFVGGVLKYMQVDSSWADDNASAVVLGVTSGAKFFLTEYLALSANLALEVATDEVFPAGKDLEIWHARFETGLRVFF